MEPICRIEKNYSAMGYELVVACGERRTRIFLTEYEARDPELLVRVIAQKFEEVAMSYAPK